jgi:uncharacterized phage infection (PIP) family protein YhgE
MATNVAIVFSGRDAGTRQLARQLQRDFADLQSSGQRLNQALGAIGASLSVGAIVAYGRAITGAMSQLDDLSEITGESVENLSTLAAEARISGTEIDKITGFANRLAKGLTDADEETKNVGAALKELGVDARDANGNLKNSTVLMREIAQALQGIQDGPGKQNILTALGGRSGAELIPFLNDLARSSETVTRVTGEQAAQAEAAERAWRRFYVEINQVGTELVSAALPAIEGTARGLADVVRANQELDRGSLAEWARDGAIALAIVTDALGGVGRLVRAVAGSFEVVFADIGRAFDGNRYGKGWEESLAERDRVVEAANKRWAELWTYNGRAVEESVRRSIEAVRLGNQALADFDQNADARDLRLRNRRQSNFTGGTPDDGRKRAAELERLRKEFERYQAELQRGAEAAAKAEQAYIDLENALADAEWEKYARGVDAYNNEIEGLKNTLDELAGVSEEARKINLTLALEDALRKNPDAYTPEQLQRIVKGIAGIRDEVSQTADQAERMALVFTSSFEKLIEGGGDAGDVFKALLEDVAKLIVQMTILEPLARNLRELFKGFGGGVGGGFNPVDALFKLFGSAGGGGIAAAGAGGGVRAASAGGGLVVNITNNVGASYGDAALAKALDDSSKATVARIVDMQSRGRLALAG